MTLQILQLARTGLVLLTLPLLLAACGDGCGPTNDPAPTAVEETSPAVETPPAEEAQPAAEVPQEQAPQQEEGSAPTAVDEADEPTEEAQPEEEATVAAPPTPSAPLLREPPRLQLQRLDTRPPADPRLRPQNRDLRLGTPGL